MENIKNKFGTVLSFLIMGLIIYWIFWCCSKLWGVGGAEGYWRGLQ